MTNQLRSLALSMFFAVTTFGCAATSSPAEAPRAGELPSDAASLGGNSWSLEGADRAFVAMSERCRSAPRSESTINNCLAAEHLAERVLHDPERALEVSRQRHARFGADGVACETELSETTRDVAERLGASDAGAVLGAR